MSSIDVLKRELDSLDENIKHWLGNGADKSSKLIKHRLEQKKALAEAVEALEKVQAVRDYLTGRQGRIIESLEGSTGVHEEVLQSKWLELEGALFLIDSLDKVKP